MPLLQIPPPSVAKNNKSAIHKFGFSESVISELLILECISEVFTVFNSETGEKRLTLDLLHVNQYLFKSKFRCKDVSTAREVLNTGDFMFSFDMKSGYNHVEIFSGHRQYLSFS